MEKYDFDELSRKLTKSISKKTKKESGIFFTPPITVSSTLEKLEIYFTNKKNIIKTILEPSCGSCEFIKAINEKYPTVNITGIEFNKTIYEAIKEKYDKENISLLNENFLTYSTQTLFDLIIGNPPYFIIKKMKEEKKEEDKQLEANKYDIKYNEWFDGRPNIFIIFILKSMDLLKDNGILCFVLPKSFINCLYYNKTRQRIYDHNEILDITECDDTYLETQQPTILLTIKKKTNDTIKKKNDKYTLKKSNNLIFGTPNNITEIKKLYKESKTLHDLNFKVSVGTVVWNQCKDILVGKEDKTRPKKFKKKESTTTTTTNTEETNSTTEETTSTTEEKTSTTEESIAVKYNTRLIYSSDIKNNKLLEPKTYKAHGKKSFIDKKGIKTTTLLVNRGYGVGSYNFQYCLLKDETYLVENHLICINYKDNTEEKDELIAKYNKIIKSLEHDKTKKFIKLYFGNNAINTTELNQILPIYGM
jgi:tRNA1(Val) A37 N6-methylase TrmN6